MSGSSSEHRTITLPNPIRLDTVPPGRPLPARIYTHCSPGRDGRYDVFRVALHAERPGARRPARRRPPGRVHPQPAAHGRAAWYGKIDGQAGASRELRARDRRPGRRRQPLEALPVRGRDGPLHRARPRRTSTVAPAPRFAVFVLTDAEARQLALRPRARHPERRTRCACARRGTPGTYRLYVTGSGHTARGAQWSSDDRRPGAPRRPRRGARARPAARSRRRAPGGRPGSPPGRSAAGLLALSLAPVGPPPRLRRRGGRRCRRRGGLAWLFLRVPVVARGRGARLRPGADPGLGRARRATANLLLPALRRRRRRRASRSRWQLYARRSRRARELGPFAWPLGALRRAGSRSGAPLVAAGAAWAGTPARSTCSSTCCRSACSRVALARLPWRLRLGQGALRAARGDGARLRRDRRLSST